MATQLAISGSTQGLDPAFFKKLTAAASHVGATRIEITSGYRDPATNKAVGGVPRSNHMTGSAVDGFAYIGGKRIPLGIALQPVVSQFGLRSGNVPGFYKGKADTVHIDDGRNQGVGADTRSQRNFAKASISSGRLSFAQLEQLWIQAGGDPKVAPQAAATALAESSGRIDALNRNPKTRDYSVGPWQINYYGNLAGQRIRAFGTPSLLQSDPLANARAAVSLYNSNKGFSPWSAYGTQRYLDALAANRGVSPLAGDYSGGNVAGSPTLGAPAGTLYGGKPGAGAAPTLGPPAGTTYGGVAAAGAVNMAYPSTEAAGAKKPPARGAAPYDWLSPLLKQFAPPSYASMRATATRQAQSEVAGLVAAYRAQQDYETKLGRQRQAAMLDAGQAAASFLRSIEGNPQAQYQQQIENTRALEGGYSPTLAADVNDRTEQLNRDLAAVNAPGRATSPATALQDVMHGLQADIPTMTMGELGRAETARANALPQATLAGASEAGMNALLAAQEQAKQYGPQILAEQAKLPALIQSYLKDAQTSGNQSLQTALQLAGLHKPIVVKGNLVDPITGRVVMSDAQTGALKPSFQTFVNQKTGEIVQVDKNTGATTVLRQGVAGTGTKAALQYKLDPKTGERGAWDPNTGTYTVLQQGTGPVPKISYVQNADGSHSMVTNYGDGRQTVSLAPGLLGQPRAKTAARAGATQWANIGGGREALYERQPDGSFAQAVGPDGKPLTRIKKGAAGKAATGPGTASWNSAYARARTYFGTASSKTEQKVARWDKNNRPVEDASGNIVYIPGKPPAPKGEVLSQLLGYNQLTPAWAKKMIQLVYSKKLYGADPLPYADILELLTKAGPATPQWQRQAAGVLASVKQYDQEGKNGRPFVTPSLALRQARASAQALWGKGMSQQQALATLLNTGVFNATRAQLEEAVRSVYAGGKVAPRFAAGSGAALAQGG